MSTQLGKELKKLRIDLGENLMEMSTKIGMSAAFLSAIETGKKRVPNDFLNKLAAEYPDVANAFERYEVLINEARKEVNMQLNAGKFEDVELATMLARKFNNLSDDQKNQMKKILEKG